ncbi:hypothetical protein BD779DRAFT_1549959 [Infundibulicybe gibba]|nr:hypothetical protein BD779DRAFT_1549959 [Infundibulicybe gibba]
MPEITAVRRLADAAKLSWELGTRTQAILELNATRYSVLTPNPLPPPAAIPSNLTSVLAPFFAIPQTIVSGRAKSNNNTVGPQPLIQDGSAADPASIGMSVLLANWTQQGGLDYAGVAKDQLDFLFNVVPKTSDGAISHRVSEVQLWSDFVYMVPPFIAYYGVLSRNRTLVLESYNQIKLYRSYLLDTNSSAWKHVLLGTSTVKSDPGNDPGHWSTGNGWAAAGMLRVLATMRNSEYANTFKNEQKDLAAWVKEIHTGMYPHLDGTNIFANYPDVAVDSPGNFYDSASTALLASTVYRFSLVWGDHTHLPIAEKTRKALSATDPNSNNGSLAHFTSDGWLTPVVDPHSYGQQGSKSAEGQAFVVQMHAAWRDWVADGSKGANGAAPSKEVAGTFLGLWFVVGALMLWS